MPLRDRASLILPFGRDIIRHAHEPRRIPSTYSRDTFTSSFEFQINVLSISIRKLYIYIL